VLRDVGNMNDAQTWAVIGIFAAIFAGQFVELRSDRREFRGSFQRIDDRFESVDGRLGAIEVTLGRIDERLKGVETRP
jgi:hypothetical protein